VDWNNWISAAPYRPFHPVYHPGKWRGWVDFGTGVLGDWTCHIIDPVFWALDLGAPNSVQAEADEYTDPRVRAETFPPGCSIRYEFPARGSRPAVGLTWFDGRRVPPRPPELEPGKDVPGMGAIVLGEKGTILYGSHGAAGARLLPETRWRAYQKPPQTIPRSQGHHEEWALACKQGGRTGSPFGYGGPLTELALLGAIALRFPGQRLDWDSAAMRIANHKEANAWLQPPRRKGWEI
jgi:predicted dehydrogenase